MAVEKSPVDWALTPLKKYAQFSGRAPRAEYWWFTLANLVVSFVIGMLEGALGLSGESGLSSFGVLSIIFSLALIVPGIAVTVRRLHDTNRTGWWILAPIIPYAAGVAMMMPALLNPEGASIGTSMGGAVIFMLVGGLLALALLVFMILPGNSGANNYGPDPYGEHENLETVFS